MNTLTKEEGLAINHIVMRSAGFLLLIQLGFGILLGIVIVIYIKSRQGRASEEELAAFENQALLLAIPVQLFFNFLCGYLALYPALRRRRKKAMLETLTQPDERPYLWSWTGIVSGTQLAGALAVTFLLGEGSHSGASGGVTIAALYGATYFVVTRLLRDGKARLILVPTA